MIAWEPNWTALRLERELEFKHGQLVRRFREELFAEW